MYIATRALSAVYSDDLHSSPSLDSLPRTRTPSPDPHAMCQGLSDHAPLAMCQGLNDHAPLDMNQGYTVPIVYRDETWEELQQQRQNAPACSSPHSAKADNQLPWRERKIRIDNALSWLRTELERMRAQDKSLLGQLQRCQETIESIKHQRALWEEASEDDLDEEDEDHWEDWEISEFERSFADGSEYSMSTLSSKDSRSSGHTSSGSTSASRSSAMSTGQGSSVTSERSSTSFQYSDNSSTVSKKRSYFRQDLEVTV